MATIERQRCLLFTQKVTLYSFWAVGVRKADLPRFEELCRHHAMAMLTADGFQETEIQRLLPTVGHRFAKTNSRPVTGSMNDHIWNSRWYFERDGGIRLADVYAVSRQLNRTPMGALAAGQHMDFPRQTDANHSPDRRGVTFRGACSAGARGSYGESQQTPLPSRTSATMRAAWREVLDFEDMATAHPQPRSRHRYTYEEYLAYERDSKLKHEYEDGVIVAMPGGSRRHNALASRVSAALEAARARGCVAFQSDQKVRVLATGKATYPDASMVCGSIEGDPADPSGATITNPILIVEVLSASTEEEDRGNKWQHYQLIPSLMEYVLVSQTHPRVESYRRLPSGAWEYRDTTEGTMELLSGATVDMATLYAELPV